MREVVGRLKKHFDPIAKRNEEAEQRRQLAVLQVQATRRAHATIRQQLREATQDVRRWNEEQARRRGK